MAVVIVARLIPSLLAAPVIGHLIDRVQRDRVAALSCVITAAATAGAAALVMADAPLLPRSPRSSASPGPRRPLRGPRCRR